MLRTSLRPIARSALRARSVRYGSSDAPTSPKQSNSMLIPLLGVGAVVVGGFYYFYVPLKHDLADRASDALQNQAKPSTLRAANVRTDVKTSVLDQDTLKQPLHKSVSSGVTPALAETNATSKPAGGNGPSVPAAVEKKAEEAKEPAQSAFNEETGEINWDCPCLGGMADGPCGEQFKAAFSCFVYSEKEPKGVECVDKFKLMQDCFREHPDVYGEEIDDDEEEVAPSKPEHDLVRREFKPEPVKRTPPPNNPVLATTPETTPSKGVAKLVPSNKRADKGPGGITPPIGEGTTPRPYSGTDKKDEHGELNAKE